MWWAASCCGASPGPSPPPPPAPQGAGPAQGALRLAEGGSWLLAAAGAGVLALQVRTLAPPDLHPCCLPPLGGAVAAVLRRAFLPLALSPHRSTIPLATSPHLSLWSAFIPPSLSPSPPQYKTFGYIPSALPDNHCFGGAAAAAPTAYFTASAPRPAPVPAPPPAAAAPGTSPSSSTAPVPIAAPLQTVPAAPSIARSSAGSGGSSTGGSSRSKAEVFIDSEKVTVSAPLTTVYFK